MTLTELRAFVNTQYRQSTSELDTVILNLANEAISHYSRRGMWRQLKGLNASITTTTAQSYDLAADFDRLIPNSVRYDYTSTYPGRSLDDVDQDRFEAFKMLGTGGSPAVCIAGPKSGSSTVFQLHLAPVFTETGKVIKYDYMKKPAALASGSDATQVPDMDYAVCYKVLQGVAEFHKDYEGAAYYREESKRQFVSALTTIVSES